MEKICQCYILEHLQIFMVTDTNARLPDRMVSLKQTAPDWRQKYFSTILLPNRVIIDTAIGFQRMTILIHQPLSIDGKNLNRLRFVVALLQLGNVA